MIYHSAQLDHICWYVAEVALDSAMAGLGMDAAHVVAVWRGWL
jgi:hypothetical protein